MSTRQKGVTPPAPVVVNGHDTSDTGTDTSVIELIGDESGDDDKADGGEKIRTADDGVADLQAQLAEERRKRELAEQEALQLRGARQNDQKELVDSRLQIIDGAISTKEAEKKAILTRIKEAKEAGDYDAEVLATDELSQVNIDLRQHHLGKSRLETEIEEAKSQPTDQFEAWIARENLPPRAAEWARAHREVFMDQRQNAKVQAAHFAAVADGVAVWSDEYFNRIEDGLAGGAREPEAETVQQPQRRQQAAPAAPVSRSSPASIGREVYPGIIDRGGGKYSLNAAASEAARISGLTPTEYIQQALKLERGSDGQMH